MTTDPTIARARRDLANMRGFIRRTGLTGWVKDRGAAGQYERAFAAILRVEDKLGVTDETVKLGARLLELRLEAQRAGLLEIGEIIHAENRAMATVDDERQRVGL